MGTEAENLKGTAKEMAGKALGNDDLEEEGQEQQQKAHAAEEAQDLAEEAQEKAAEAAEHDENT